MPRDAALDNAKGIAMLAVALFHILRGMDSAGVNPYGPVLHWADNVAYGFHTQTFLLISGYLAWPRAANILWQTCRQLSLYHAYLLWSLITWCLSYMLSASVNQPVTAADLLWLPIIPIAHFWFLLALMAGTALLAVLRSTRALAAAMIACVGLTFTPALAWFGAPYHLIFLLLGGLLAAGPGLPRITWPVGLGATVVLVAAAYMVGAKTSALQDPRLLWVSVLGCIACLWLATNLASSPRMTAMLSFVSRYSMPLYLLHILAGAGTRIILAQALPSLPVTGLVLLSLGASIALPILVARMARQLGVDDLMGFSPLIRPALQPIRSPAS